ncbi:MAG: hypothetical protein H6Q90_6364, partial [Deltaproteobacteria bacterium]|nr:hypothetical protein [Deltaproteobacteria bacterium]
MMSRIGFHGPTAALAAALAALATNGCVTTDPGSDSCSEGKCDEADLPDSAIADSPCDGLITDRSGRGHHKVAGRLHDRLATLAFQAGDDCPTTLDDMIAKIARTDPACAGDKLSTSTRAVSETAKLLGRPTDYRLVTTESCGFDQSQIFFSTFGVPAVTPELPNDQEIIAFDETSGVFNYYTSDGKSLQFFGNSTDLLKGSDGEDRRCANCHVGGGLVMKELESPWLHWNISNDLPGADDLIKAHPILGSSFSATSLENEVKASAETVNKLAVKLRKASGDVRGLLRPLFCSPELNITAQHVTAPEVPEALVLDNRFSGGLSFPYDAVAYQAQLVANNQLVDGGEGRRDTVLAFAIANR